MRVPGQFAGRSTIIGLCIIVSAVDPKQKSVDLPNINVHSGPKEQALTQRDCDVIRRREPPRVDMGWENLKQQAVPDPSIGFMLKRSIGEFDGSARV